MDTLITTCAVNMMKWYQDGQNIVLPIIKHIALQSGSKEMMLLQKDGFGCSWSFEQEQFQCNIYCCLDKATTNIFIQSQASLHWWLCTGHILFSQQVCILHPWQCSNNPLTEVLPLGFLGIQWWAHFRTQCHCWHIQLPKYFCCQPAWQCPPPLSWST